MTDGLGADSVLECIGTPEAMEQATGCARRGGSVGVPHGPRFHGEKLFYSLIHLHAGPAPVRRYLPHLIELVQKGTIRPGKIFDLELPLDQVAEGYRAMDECRQAAHSSARVFSFECAEHQKDHRASDKICRQTGRRRHVSDAGSTNFRRTVNATPLRFDISAVNILKA